VSDDLDRFDDDYDDWDGGGVDDEFEDDDIDRAPDFGCACEGALFVDTVCAGCIGIMKDMDEEAASDADRR
jgi:hypothetical protein